MPGGYFSTQGIRVRAPAWPRATGLCSSAERPDLPWAVIQSFPRAVAPPLPFEDIISTVAILLLCSRTHLYAARQHVGTDLRPQGVAMGSSRRFGIGGMRDAAIGLRRMSLLGSRVHKPCVLRDVLPVKGERILPVTSWLQRERKGEVHDRSERWRHAL